MSEHKLFTKDLKDVIASGEGRELELEEALHNVELQFPNLPAASGGGAEPLPPPLR